jgi:hypothetical protein
LHTHIPSPSTKRRKSSVQSNQTKSNRILVRDRNLRRGKRKLRFAFTDLMVTNNLSNKGLSYCFFLFIFTKGARLPSASPSFASPYRLIGHRLISISKASLHWLLLLSLFAGWIDATLTSPRNASSEAGRLLACA